MPERDLEHLRNPRDGRLTAVFELTRWQAACPCGWKGHKFLDGFKAQRQADTHERSHKSIGKG